MCEEKVYFFFFQAEDGIRDKLVTGVQTCALPILGEETGLRRRAESLAGLLVVGEAGRHGGERDRKIGAVAGADADGAEGAGLRTEIDAWRHRIVVVAEQIVEKIAG